MGDLASVFNYGLRHILGQQILWESNLVFLNIMFLMWTILKVIIEFVSILLLLYVLVGFFFSHEACGIFALQPGIESTRPALEGKS